MPNEEAIEFIKEYMEMNGYDHALSNFDKELRGKEVPQAPAPTSPHCPHLVKLCQTGGENKQENEAKELNRQHSSVLQSAR